METAGDSRLIKGVYLMRCMYIILAERLMMLQNFLQMQHQKIGQHLMHFK